jgi:hypothetical protein
MRSIIEFSLIFGIISCALILGIIGNKENISKILSISLTYICVSSLVLCSFSLILEFIYFF